MVTRAQEQHSLDTGSVVARGPLRGGQGGLSERGHSRSEMECEEGTALSPRGSTQADTAEQMPKVGATGVVSRTEEKVQGEQAQP